MVALDTIRPHCLVYKIRVESLQRRKQGSDLRVNVLRNLLSIYLGFI